MNESQKLNAALAKLQRMASDNLTLGARVNAEQLYAEAYDELVRAGLKPRLRGKYRIR